MTADQVERLEVVTALGFGLGLFAALALAVYRMVRWIRGHGVLWISHE